MNLQEGNYIACITYPLPRSIDNLRIKYEGTNYEKARSVADLENLASDYSTCSVCKISNGQIIKLYNSGKEMEILKFKSDEEDDFDLDLDDDEDELDLDLNEDEEFYLLTDEEELMGAYGKQNLPYVRNQLSNNDIE